MTPEDVFSFKEKVADLQGKLLASHPEMPVLLRTIHSQLRQDPELVTTLSEEDIGVIVRGLSIHTNTQITATVSAGVKKQSAAAMIKAALKSSGPSSSVSDLF